VVVIKKKNNVYGAGLIDPYEAIQKGKKLKKTKTVDKSGPYLE